MIVLGIESSCDECSVAIVKDRKSIIALKTHSQIEKHIQHNGVVPELASRLHVQYIAYLYQKVMQEYEKKQSLFTKNMTHRDNTDRKDLPIIEGIAVSVCPGLRGSLLVGAQFAKGLALAKDIPLIGIDHIKAHFYSACIENTVDYPYIGVVVSGGHTVIAIVHDFDTIEVKGTTLDDSCGEAFDKVARELGIPYPGGAKLDLYAEKGNEEAAYFPQYSIKTYGYDMSYSGLKTAVIHHREKYWNKAYPQSKENIAAAFRFAAIEIIIERIEALVKETGISTVAFGGGVSCNSYLRRRMKSIASVISFFPSLELCMDNAAMIAGLGDEYLTCNIHSNLDITVSSRNYVFKGLRNRI